MADEVRADPEAIVRLAQATLAGADDMSDCWSAAQGVVTPPGSAFGNSTAGPAFATACTAAATSADTAWRGVAGVYEGDVDRLYRVAFAYQAADAAAAERQRRARGEKPAIP